MRCSVQGMYLLSLSVSLSADLSIENAISFSRGKSGIIVLPCGAGKTLVGITACSTIRKRTLVLCTSTYVDLLPSHRRFLSFDCSIHDMHALESSVAVEQWRQQFIKWSTIDPKNISCFTSSHKPKGDAVLRGITIATYTMVASGGRRSVYSQKVPRVPVWPPRELTRTPRRPISNQMYFVDHQPNQKPGLGPVASR